MARRQFWSFGLRTEALTLLPIAVLLLVAVGLFTLLSYRRAVEGFLDTERQRVIRLARDIAAETATSSSPPSAADLRRWAPQAGRVAILEEDGSSQVQVGGLPEGNLLLPLGDERPPFAAIGPDRSAPGTIIGFALAGRFPSLHYVRVDLPAAALAAQLRSLKLLTWIVAVISAAITLLILLYSRHLVAPIDRLLERARAAEGSDAPVDEVAFLLSTFDRAMTALTQREAAQQPAMPLEDDVNASDVAGDRLTSAQVTAHQATGNQTAGNQIAGDDLAALERTLATSLESGLLLLDRNQRVLALNPIGQTLLELAAPLAGTLLDEHLTAYPALIEMIQKAAKEQQGVQRAEIQIRTTAGERTLGLTVHLLRRGEGIGGYLVLFADLTEARRAAGEKELGQRIAQLGEMAAGVAHELRNGVATITGYLGLLERHPADAVVKDYVAEMRHESEQLERVVTDFLTFARPGSARIDELDLPALLRRVTELPTLPKVELVVEALHENHTDTTDTAGAKRTANDRMTIRGDAQLLERALFNLVRNAVEAQTENDLTEEPVVVRLETAAEQTVISIEDRGRGFSAAQREKLFQPFVTTKAEGVGLGLSLARRIIDLHHGKLELIDRAGGGTIARISLFA